MADQIGITELGAVAQEPVVLDVGIDPLLPEEVTHHLETAAHGRPAEAFVLEQARADAALLDQISNDRHVIAGGDHYLDLNGGGWDR
jgi:hypothetical protein